MGAACAAAEAIENPEGRRSKGFVRCVNAQFIAEFGDQMRGRFLCQSSRNTFLLYAVLDCWLTVSSLLCPHAAAVLAGGNKASSLTSVAAWQGVAGLVLVAPAIVAMRLSRSELAAALEGVTDEVERDRVLAKFADFRSNTGGNIMCEPHLKE